MSPLTLGVIGVVSGALLLGTAWGVYGNLSKPVEGFLVAVAGGALTVAAVLELIEPALEDTNLGLGLAFVLLGALVFTGLNYVIEKKIGAGGGGGLLLAITLDGIPENLALGVALIGAGPLQVAALSGSILLSNLPEAAGGAKEMVEDGRSTGQIFLLWGGAALLLSLAALAGNLLLAGVDEAVLGSIRCFAGGAVVATLATEVFPKAFHKDQQLAGLAAAFGLILALWLNELG